MTLNVKGIKLKPVQNMADGNAMNLYIYSFIGEDYWDEGFNEKTLRDALNEHGDVSTINVHINSQGGSVFSGIAIYNVLRAHSATVNVFVEGYAASIASVIMLAGDTREAMQGTSVMIHDPSTFASGTSSDLRKTADVLDSIKEQIISIYVDRTNLTADEATNMMTEETWMGADLAHKLGFATTLSSQQADPQNLNRLDVSMYRRAPDPTQAGKTMPRDVKNTNQAGANNADQGGQQAPVQPQTQPPTQDPVTPTTPQAEPAEPTAQATPMTVAQLQARNDEINVMMQISPDLKDVLTECLGSTNMTMEQVRNKAMAARTELGNNTPVAGDHSNQHGLILPGEDERDKFINSAQQWIFASNSVRGGDGKPVDCDNSNPFRGMSISSIAATCLNRAGVSTRGMTPSEIGRLIFNQHTRSDFDTLLQNGMYKVMLNSYNRQTTTWQNFCRVGAVKDYRENPRYKMGYVSNLKKVMESGELKKGELNDAVKEIIKVTRHGLILSFTLEIFVNDDMGVFFDAANFLGAAAARAPDQAFYALLNANGGLGPKMQDGKTLFHASHKNIVGPSPLSAEGVDEADALMGEQTDPNDKDFISLESHVMLVHRSKRGTALRINRDENDPDANNKTRSNIAQGTVEEVIWSPRVAHKNSYRLFADPNIHPAFEMAFLEGRQEPIVEEQRNFSTKGKDYSVELDFGCGVLDHRPAVLNLGE